MGLFAGSDSELPRLLRKTSGQVVFLTGGSHSETMGL